MPGSAADSDARSPAGQRLARELTGDLLCVRCRYNLKGLTIRGMCSECGMSVRTTLLAKIDPLAKELRPIARPQLTAAGLIVWSAAAFLCANCVWMLRIADLIGGTQPLTLVRIAVVVFAAISGLGACVLIRPHAGLPGRYVAMAAVGVAAYVPLCWLLAQLHVRYDPLAGPAYGTGAVITTNRVLLRLGVVVVSIIIVFCLRLNARQLAARWLLMRVGAVDRQTMLVLAGVLALSAFGDATLLVAAEFQPGLGDAFRLMGGVMIQIGSVLFTIGLLGLTVDSIRLWDVIATPPLAVEDVLTSPAPRVGGPVADTAANPLRSGE